MNIKLYTSPYWNLLDYKKELKVNLFLIKILFYIYFFVAKDYIRKSKYIEISSNEDRDLANYFCGLLKRKYNLDINIALRDKEFGLSFIPSCGKYYDKGVNGEKFENKIIDSAFLYFKGRRKPAGLPPSL